MKKNEKSANAWIEAGISFHNDVSYVILNPYTKSFTTVCRFTTSGKFCFSEMAAY